MKVQFFTLLLIGSIVSSVFFTSCGKDGADGKSYVAIDYEYPKPDTYWDDNDDVPYGFTWGANYLSESGKFVDFTYEYYNYEGYNHKWSGYYTLAYAGDGEDGKMFSDGADGKNAYTKMYCVVTGDNWLERTKSSNLDSDTNMPNYEVKQLESDEENKNHYYVEQYNKNHELILTIDVWEEVSPATENTSNLNNKISQ